MTEEERNKLEFIKQELREGSYRILESQQWDEFSRDLSRCGANLLKNIESLRTSVFWD